MDYRQIAETIRTSLRSAIPPIAVTFTDNLPEGIPLHSGAAPAGCVFWEEAARGAFATSSGDHQLCAIGVHTHNFADPPASQSTELTAVLSVLAQMEYVRPQDVADIPVLSSRAKYVVYAPLGETALPPDAALVFAESRQGLVITEAVQQVDGGIPPALGRPACAVIPQAVNTGRAALSLGCCGARAYLSTMTDDIALWAFPGSRIGEYAERIAVLGKANDVLREFHRLRMEDVRGGLRPTYAESMARMGA